MENRLFPKILTIILIILLFSAPTLLLSAEVNPDYWHETVYGGDSFDISKEVTIPAIPETLDFLLLEDESGSFADDIALMQGETGLAAQIWDGLVAEGIDFRGGVAGFIDFAQSPWGGSWTHGNDWVYRLITDMTYDRTAWLNGINQLKTNNGADYPEAQLAALKTAADGSPWDSNGDGDYTDPEDTPAGENPSWGGGGRTKIVVLVTDATYHYSGDGTGWPGPSYAATVDALNAENIHVIVLATEGPLGSYATLATATGGTTKSIESDSSDIVEAFMDALDEILTDVWYTVDYCDPELSLTISPPTNGGPSYADVSGGETYTFTETVSVAYDAVPGDYYCTVTYYSNGYPEGGSVGTQEIHVTVEPVPVDIDIKPWSWPNSINPKSNGVVPVAILGSDTFDVDTVDVSTVMFGPDELYPNVAAPAHDITDPDVYADHHVYPDAEEPYWTANMDSWTDLVFHFHQKDCGFEMTDEYGYLTGQLLNGQWFMGRDYVRVLK